MHVVTSNNQNEANILVTETWVEKSYSVSVYVNYVHVGHTHTTLDVV